MGREGRKDGDDMRMNFSATQMDMKWILTLC